MDRREQTEPQQIHMEGRKAMEKDRAVGDSGRLVDRHGLAENLF